MTSIDRMERSIPRTLERGGILTRLGSLSLLKQAAAAGAFLLAYVALEWISFIHEYKGVPITPWNPGLGVVFALMVLGGPRYSAVLFAGVVIAETTVLQTKLQWPISSRYCRHFRNRLRYGCHRCTKVPATRRQSLSFERRDYPARSRRLRRGLRRASPLAALATERAARTERCPGRFRAVSRR